LSVGLAVGLAAGLVCGLATWPFVGLGVGLVSGLVFGLDVGITHGGKAFLQHFGLRLFLICRRWAPWRYERLLNYAADLLFLRRVGGGYVFIHRLAQDHFAARYTEPGDSAHMETEGQGWSLTN
jgi:hypothetical protein